jgi:GH25 family lysozyme M1 (1,4-beta-N-acetylmuramidase)
VSNALLMADVSSNQGPIDVAMLHRAGYRALAVKATEGASYVNPYYAAAVDEAHRLGMTVVHYHFGVASATGVGQARHFLAVVTRHVQTRRDWLACDTEGQPASYQQWPQPDGARLFTEAFLHVVWDQAPRVGLLKRRVRRLIYGPPYFLRDAGVRPAHGERLWVADYSGHPSLIPPGWKTWTVWQFTDKATVPGIHGPVDESHIRPGVTRRLRPYPTLRPGMSGPAVRLLQHLLRAHGHKTVVVTGTFDTSTRIVVNTVKRTHGWKADGVAGPRVWRALT